MKEEKMILQDKVKNLKKDIPAVYIALKHIPQEYLLMQYIPQEYLF